MGSATQACDGCLSSLATHSLYWWHAGETAGALPDTPIPVAAPTPCEERPVECSVLRALSVGWWTPGQRAQGERSWLGCCRGRAPVRFGLQHSPGAKSHLVSLRLVLCGSGSSSLCKANLPSGCCSLKAFSTQPSPLSEISLPFSSLALLSPWGRFPVVLGCGLKVKCYTKDLGSTPAGDAGL